VAAGRVLVSGAPATKTAHLVAPGEPVQLVGPPPPFVGRGGVKLDAALDRFSVDVSGKRALDAGASTGGFTDCLLQRGAAHVVAVDVGRSQLHERLRADGRVEVLDGFNVRHLDLARVGGRPFEVVVADLSFISLRTVMPVLLGPLAEAGADAVLLVKPQFEAGRAVVSRGRGVVGDPEEWRRALAGVGAAVSAAGAAMMGTMVSPITGAEGNVEFLLHARAHMPGGADVPDLDRVVAAAAGS
jgi:23S rRNA (cytidine1920-2'-O)/16S rRNA (cytidine1409-2'-O)-methyltransferase